MVTTRIEATAQRNEDEWLEQSLRRRPKRRPRRKQKERPPETDELDEELEPKHQLNELA